MEGRLDPRLVVLMGARLGLALVSLAVTFVLDASGDELTLANRPGPYGTVAFAFVATVAYGVALPRVRNRRRFALLNLATDLAIVTALVQFSGGPESVFTFLYVLVVVYAAMLFERPGAVAAAAAAAGAYGVVLLAAHRGWPGLDPGHVPPPGGVLLTLWGVHLAALGLASGLGTFLANELRRTGEALVRRTSDLEKLRGLHQRTVESLMSGLLTTDVDGRITSFNPEAERITGLPRAATLGRSIEEVLPVAPAVGHRKRMPYRNQRGEELFLGVGTYVLRDPEARPEGFVVIFQDVSQVVEMERELRRSERLAAVGELSASIAHEIRNPLAAISGSVQILARRDADRDPESQRLIEIAMRETLRLDRLVTDFLRYARPGAPRRESVRLAEVVEEVVSLFRAAGHEGIAVTVDVPADLTLDSDAAQLHQVLWNLVLNAAQAQEGAGRIAIDARVAPVPQEGSGAGRREPEGEQPPTGEKGPWVEVSVVDDGPGIPAEVRERIFDPFFTTKSDGSGLGLALVHRIVEGHGGSVRLESGLGRGTAIRLRLPRAAEVCAT